MNKAKIFWSGRWQAVRLPKEFRFETDEVSIRLQAKQAARFCAFGHRRERALLRGRGRRMEENLTRLDALLFPVLEFDREDARQAGEIRAMLAISGTQVGPFDVLIGGQARARGLTLLTRNVREVERIKDLATESW